MLILRESFSVDVCVFEAVVLQTLRSIVVLRSPTTRLIQLNRGGNNENAALSPFTICIYLLSSMNSLTHKLMIIFAHI